MDQTEIRRRIKSCSFRSKGVSRKIYPLQSFSLLTTSMADFTNETLLISYLEGIEQALGSGATTLFESIGENVDPVLDSLLGRNLIKKGRYVQSFKIQRNGYHATIDVLLLLSSCKKTKRGVTNP